MVKLATICDYLLKYSRDGADTITGGSGSDALLGDNGQVVREPVSWTSAVPWRLGVVYRRHSVNCTVYDCDVFRYDDPVRTFRRFDVVDFAGAGDMLTGGDGNDHLFGQTGPDMIHAGAGDDEISGGLGDDNIDAGPGHDTEIFT
jgi:Ca2+-binding RTX toxin-like protein